MGMIAPGNRSVTGLTSNPTIFHQAVKGSRAYDDAIRRGLAQGRSGEALFFDLALEDIGRAADLFRPIHERTNGVDGWVSIEVSPLLAYDTAGTLVAAKEHEERPLCDRGGDLRRHPRQRDAVVFARAVLGRGRGISLRHRAAHELLGSPRWRRICNEGVRPQRLLWASTGTKDPSASPTLYVDGLAAPFTVNTMPEATLRALAEKDELASILQADGGDCEEVLTEFAAADVDVTTLAARLQDEGAAAFVKSWNELLAVIQERGSALRDSSRGERPLRRTRDRSRPQLRR